MNSETSETLVFSGKEYVKSEGLLEWIVKVNGRRVDGWEDSEVGRQAAMRASSQIPGSIVVLEKTPFYTPKDYKPNYKIGIPSEPPKPFPKRCWWEFWK